MLASFLAASPTGADLFKFNNVNLDVLTETVRTTPTHKREPSTHCSHNLLTAIWLRRALPQYDMRFYYQYLTTWPEYFKVQQAPSGRIMGYGTYMPCVRSIREG